MSSAFRRAAKKPTPSASSSSSGASLSTGDATAAPTAKSGATTASLFNLRGVKPWTGGIHLTSVGVNDLDVILGGGQPLGTCILLQEDRFARDLATSLMRYWCAEAVSHEQNLVIPVPRENEFESLVSSISLTADEAYAEDESMTENVPSKAELQEFLYSLPRNLHWDKEKSKEKKQREQQESSQNASSSKLNVLEELDEEDEEEKDDAEAGLEIAWQYRLSVQQERLAQTSGSSIATKSSSTSSKSRNVFCHSFDLSGRMKDQEQETAESLSDPLNASHHVVVASCCQEDSCHRSALCGVQWFQKLVRIIEERRTKDPNKVIRLFLYHPPHLETLAVALPLLLAHVREMNWPVVVMVAIPPPVTLTPSDSRVRTMIERVVDVVLVTEGFSSRRDYPPPPEFRHLQGLLTIRKASTATAATANGGGHYGDLTTSRRPAAYSYGLKRDRRKLHIPLLHIPPEDYAQGGGSTGGVRSGAGRVDVKAKPSSGSSMECSSNISGSVLDF